MPEAEQRRWSTFARSLEDVGLLRVPRWLGIGVNAPSVQLHGFTDASERAIAAAVYLRGSAREHPVMLVMAKTKLAPVKQVSLPRLELSAAALLARIARYIRTLYGIKEPPHLWSDSTVALAWIRGHPSRWRTYVANRVAEIQTKLPDACWRHVASGDNPADCAIRGLTPRDLATFSLWWNGPRWLSDDASNWPPQPPLSTTSEARNHIITALAAQASIVASGSHILRFSTLNRLLRVTAWCLRCRPRGRACEKSPTLAPQELTSALQRLIRLEQAIFFGAELTALRARAAVPPRSPLQRLTPFTDDDGVLRVGGRLKHSLLNPDEQHPVILPRGSHLTRLLVEHHHRRTLHGGVQLTLSTLRQQYWILRGREAVKVCLRRCVVCVRHRASATQQLMADLPARRVRPARPFLHSGVD